MHDPGVLSWCFPSALDDNQNEAMWRTAAVPCSFSLALSTVSGDARKCPPCHASFWTLPWPNRVRWPPFSIVFPFDRFVLVAIFREFAARFYGAPCRTLSAVWLTGEVLPAFGPDNSQLLRGCLATHTRPRINWTKGSHTDLSSSKSVLLADCRTTLALERGN